MRWKFALIAAAFAVPAVALLGFGLTRDPGEIESPLPGRMAPKFTLAAFTSGEPTPQHPGAIPKVDTVSLAKLKGQVVVLNFYASWCLACREEHHVLQDVASRYVGTDVKFEGVLYQDMPSAALKWFSDFGWFPYPQLADPQTATAIDYGLYGVPETFFIGRDGKVAYKQVGPVTEEMLVAQIEALRNEKPASGGAGGAP